MSAEGRVTIPKEIKDEFGLIAGLEFIVETTSKGILFKTVSRILENAGKYSAYGSPEELKKELDKLREEY